MFLNLGEISEIKNSLSNASTAPNFKGLLTLEYTRLKFYIYKCLCVCKHSANLTSSYYKFHLELWYSGSFKNYK